MYFETLHKIAHLFSLGPLENPKQSQHKQVWENFEA